MEMIKSAKGSLHEDDFEEDEDFVLKKECSTTTHSNGNHCSSLYINVNTSELK